MSDDSKKIALVTGGARGIGKSICEKFAQEGIFVILVSQSEKSSSSAADEINKSFPNMVDSYAIDVSDFTKVQDFGKDMIERYGKVDILVNNAGITRDGLCMKMKEEDWDDVINVNLKGAFNVIKSVQKSLIRQKDAKIINISSTVGVVGNAGQVNYAASKAGLIGLTKSLAREFSGRGVCVNAVAPGFITTDMTDELSDKIKDNVQQMIPFKRFGVPREISDLVYFLASQGSSYITGQVICVDGGMCI